MPKTEFGFKIIRMRSIALAFTALFICAQIGCKHTTAAKLQNAPLTLQPGWKNHESKAGFSMAGPPNWKLMPPSAMPAITLGGDATGVEPVEPPDVISPQEQAVQDSHNVLFKLYDNNVRALPGEAPTAVLVKKVDPSGTLEDTAQDVKHGLGSDVELTPVSLPIGPAVQLKKLFKTAGGDEVTNLVYVLVNGEDAYKFVFEATNNAEPITSMAKPMMETVRFK